MEDKLKNIFFEIYERYEWIEDVLLSLKNCVNKNEISEDEYHFIQCNFENWVKEYQKSHPNKQCKYFN